MPHIANPTAYLCCARVCQPARCHLFFRYYASMADSETLWRGRWWLPEAPEDEQYGTLICSETGALRLELVGGFDDTIKTPLEGGQGASISPGDGFPMILGQCGNEYFTLLDCSTISLGGMLFLNLSNHILNVSRALRGVALDYPDEPVFSGIELEIDYLLFWSCLTTMSAELKLDEQQRWSGWQDAHTAPVDALTAEWRNLSITVDLAYSAFKYKTDNANARSLSASEKAQVMIRASRPTSYSGFDRHAKCFQDLLTFSLNYPCAQRSVELVLSEHVAARSAATRNVQVLGKRVYSTDQSPHNDLGVGHKFFFRLNQVATFGELIPAWYDLYDRCFLACNMLFGLKYLSQGFISTRVLTVASALESMHRSLGDHKSMPDDEFDALMQQVMAGVEGAERRQWVKSRLHNQLSYGQRAREIARTPNAEAVQLLLTDSAKWSLILRECRNGLAHASEQNGLSNGELLFRLLRVTSTLLSLTLMEHLGISAVVELEAVEANQEVAYDRREFARLMVEHFT